MSADPVLALPTAPTPTDLSAPAATPPAALAEHDVHLWRLRLNPPVDGLAELARNLSPDERERAARFRFERDRARFTAARGLLRSLLADYLARPADQLRFVYGPRGKPALAPMCNPVGLRFNLAHADGLAVYAIARHREVGVDLERVRPIHDMHLVAARCFSIRECAQLRSLPRHLQTPAFFNGWTRKEAVLKALGEGVATEVRRVEVALLPGEPARLLNLDNDPARAAEWTLADFDAGPGLAAALAVQGSGFRVVLQ
ncbi:MAG: 4'-phosphopantetheinyl transferase superfamily protein [Verrucomicrobia bacterium]|nr:4'-phosphopantetheinyl transferase superfamily protein [Verrucomicrobiota bacterium]